MKKLKRFTILAVMSIGDIGPVQPGEVVTTERVAESTLREIAAAGNATYLDTLQWNPEAAEGRGAWETAEHEEPDPPTNQNPPLEVSKANPGGTKTGGEGTPGGGPAAKGTDQK